MDGVSIFLAVFACTPDALSCNDLSSPRNYRNMGECQVARDALLDVRDLEGSPLLFARCRYVARESEPDLGEPETCCERMNPLHARDAS